MSFLHTADKLIRKNNDNLNQKKKNVCQLKFIASSTDVRAWCNSSDQLRQYMLESFSHSSLEDNEQHYKLNVTTKRQIFSKFRPIHKPIRKILRSKSYSSENLHQSVSKTISSTRSSSQSTFYLEYSTDVNKIRDVDVQDEVDNLRNLVKDLNEQVLYLSEFKKENAVLRNELNKDVRKQLSEAEDEIKYLTKKLELYCNIEEKYESLQNDYSSLKEQYSQVSKILETLKQEKQNIVDELIKKKNELQGSNSRALVVSYAAVDNEVLKDRIQTKEDKINFLLGVIEKQEFTIHDMTLEMQSFKNNFSYKEEKFVQNLAQLRLTLDQETKRAENLENQLDATEQMVKELETLRDQFRITNSSMMEDIHTYKRQFNKLRSTSENMIKDIKQLKAKIIEKDEKINKLSIYPHSALSVVYFSHLENILNSTNISLYNVEQANNAMKYMKRIIKQIKNEIWNTDEIDTEFYIKNAANQTELLLIEKYTQHDKFISDQSSQTVVSDEFIFKYNQAQMLIKKLTISITNMEETISMKDNEITSLEGKLISCIEEKAIIICQVNDLRNKNTYLNNQLIEKNKQIETSESLLKEAMEEFNDEKCFKENVNSLFMNTLDSIFSEYSSYISVLKTFIDYNEQNLNIVYNLLINDINTDKSNMIEMNEDINNFINSLNNEKIVYQDIYSKLKSLKETMCDSNNYIKTIEGKLIEAESTIEQLQSTTTETGYIASEESLKKDEDIKYKDSKVLKNTYQKRILKRYKREKQELKKKIFNMEINSRRVNKFVTDLQNKINFAEKLISELNLVGDELTYENNVLKEERLNLIKDIEEYQDKITNLEINLSKSLKENNVNLEDKQRIEEALLKLLKKLEKYKNKIAKHKKVTRLLNNKYELQKERSQIELNDVLMKYNQNVIIMDELKKELERLQNEKELAKSLKVSHSVQVKLIDLQQEEKYKVELNSMKEHYDKFIKTIEKEYSIKSEKAQKQHLNNLKSMKDNYERDIKNINKLHNEKITNMQILHEDELKELKKKEKHIIFCDKTTVVNFYHTEIEKLKQNYLTLLSENEKNCLGKIQEIKLLEFEKFSKEKHNAVKDVKHEMEINLNKLRRIFKKNQKRVKESYENKINSLHNKYKSIMKKELMKLSKIKVETIDEETQSEELISLKDVIDTEIPVKEESSLKLSNLFGNETGDTPSLDSKVLIKSFETEEISELKINEIFKNNILNKCTTFIPSEIDLIPIQDKQENNTFLHHHHVSTSVLKENEFLLHRIRELENEVHLRSMEIEKNVILFNKEIKQEHMKNKEMVSLLDQEMNHSNEIQCRLGSEYNRAEQLQIELEELRIKYAYLNLKFQESEEMLEKEKTHVFALTNEIEKLSTHGEHADELELSLLRLRHKLDQALECEKRLTLELRKEMQHKKKIEAMLRINEITESQAVESKPVASKSDSDLKVIFVQQCGILHTWSK